VAILAPFFLGERLTRAKAVAAGIGFLGVLAVARPGVSPVGLGHAAALLAAIGFAMNTIYTKQIMRHDAVLCVLFWMTLAQSLASLVLSLPGGIPWPSPEIAPWIVAVALTGLSAHYCLTSALGHAPASVVAPMEFLRLPVVSVAAMLLYAEPLRSSVLVGALVIVAANFYNLRAERARAAEPLPPSTRSC
jgi:drug/metabolite transporter (DMT)-like permease